MLGVRWMFGGAVFLGSFLLFVCEPMAARQLLPAFGGSAAVWMTCLVFFQAGLLGGYLYAHWMTKGVERRWRALLHSALLMVAVGLAAAWAAGLVRVDAGSGYPVLRIFAALSLSIGVPFVLLGATSPLLQVWFVRVEGRAVPYRLFALSNLASLLALLLYPAVVEPRLTLYTQRWLWFGGLLVFAVISAALAWKQPVRAGSEEPVAEDEQASATPRARLLWFLLPLGASMQLSAVTGHLTNNVAAIPLLWVLPLAVYLMSFIVAFEMPWLFRRGLVSRFLIVMLAGLGQMLAKTDVSVPMWVALVFFLLELFAACWFLHAELFARRPKSAGEATGFYLSIAAGGVLGAFLVGIAAPLLLSANYDLAIAFFVTAALVLAVVWPDGWTQRLLWVTACVLLVSWWWGCGRLIERARCWRHGTSMAACV